MPRGRRRRRALRRGRDAHRRGLAAGRLPRRGNRARQPLSDARLRRRTGVMDLQTKSSSSPGTSSGIGGRATAHAFAKAARGSSWRPASSGELEEVERECADLGVRRRRGADRDVGVCGGCGGAGGAGRARVRRLRRLGERCRRPAGGSDRRGAGRGFRAGDPDQAARRLLRRARGHRPLPQA